MVAEGGSQFALRRQGDPQLEGLDRGYAETAVPDAPTGAHPFNVAGLHRSFVIGGFGVMNLPVHQQGQRRDAGMRVPAKALLANRILRIDEIEKDKGLNHLTDVGGADHADHWPVRVAARAENYAAADLNDASGQSSDDGIHGTLSK